MSTLGDKTLISKLVDGPFGTQIKVGDYRASGIPLLRVSNCRENEVSDENLVYIEPEHHARLLRSEVRPGDVVLTKTGHVLGYAAVFPDGQGEGANISSHLVLMRTTTRLLPGFLAAYLRTEAGQDQVYRWGQKATKPELNTIEIRQFLIPVPKPKEQLKLLAILDAARSERRGKLDAADALLAGLNGFVLGAMGLKLPPPDRSMAYGLRFAEIERHRLDVHFYQPYLRDTERRVRQAGVGTTALGALLASPPINGVDAREFTTHGRRYLRVQNVRPFELETEEIKYVQSEHDKAVALRRGDILLTRKGTFGVAAVVTGDYTDCLISSEIMLLRLSPATHIATDFLVAWINCTAGQTLLDRYRTGGIMGHLTQDVVSEFPVPSAPTEVQHSIAEEVTDAATRRAASATRPGSSGRMQSAALRRNCSRQRPTRKN